MSSTLKLPLLIEPEQLADQLTDTAIRIIDLSKASLHTQLHVPGAVHMEYTSLVASNKPVMGLVPETPQLEHLLGAHGITTETAVVAYDDEGGGKAARLLWTLDLLGHQGPMSLLNGGLHAWANEGLPQEQGQSPVQQTTYRAAENPGVSATAEYILQNLKNPQLRLLDARSPAEFDGSKRFAERGGHIPGARLLDWSSAMDPARNLRMRSPAELQAMLQERDVLPQHQVVTYCQTHHRSSYLYWLLKILGYQQVRGYPGSWSDWGNRSDTPIEV